MNIFYLYIFKILTYEDTNDYDITDDSAASDNRVALEQFFKMFPSLQKNKLFITGESYAGIYVPTLAETILQGWNFY